MKALSINSSTKYVSHHSIWRLYKAHGLNRLGYKKKWQRYPQRYSKPLPGDRVQVDVKFLKNINIAGRYYQFTAIDDCTHMRVLRIYDHNTVKSATDFIQQGKKKSPLLGERAIIGSNLPLPF